MSDFANLTTSFSDPNTPKSHQRERSWQKHGKGKSRSRKSKIKAKNQRPPRKEKKRHQENKATHLLIQSPTNLPLSPTFLIQILDEGFFCPCTFIILQLAFGEEFEGREALNAVFLRYSRVLLVVCVEICYDALLKALKNGVGDRNGNNVRSSRV